MRCRFLSPLMLLMALVLIAVGYSSVRKTLRGTAETLMPYLPKKRANCGSSACPC